jgi:hypothetical protein
MKKKPLNKEEKKNIENLFDEIANFYVKDLLNYENDRFTFK